MKKVLFFTTLILLYAVSFSAYAFTLSDDGKTIEIYSITDIATRSISDTPSASIRGHLLTVEASDTGGMYFLTIEDSFGTTVYSSTLPADGMEYSYDLSGIGKDTFTLTLEGPSGKYEGIFWIQ